MRPIVVWSTRAQAETVGMANYVREGVSRVPPGEVEVERSGKTNAGTASRIVAAEMRFCCNPRRIKNATAGPFNIVDI